MSRLRFDALLAFFDNLPFRKARVKGLGKETTVYVVYPYGVTGNAPEGALCVSWQASGQESDRVAIVDFPQIRPKGLKPGEVVVSNYLTKSEVRFRANGDIDITSVNNVNITVAGDLTATITGDADVTATNIALTATTEITLAATDIEITGSLTNNSINIGGTHNHPQANDSGGNTEVDTGVPQ